MPKPVIPTDVHDRMLFAVDKFDESHNVDAWGTPHDWNAATKEFFQALAEWGPYALVGRFSMTTDTETGQVAIMFSPAE